MPTLYVLAGPELGRSFSIRAGDTLGRSPDRIITLRHTSVSRQHAHFEETGGVWYVVDDGSQNGVSFEGQRSDRAALFDGAEFALGEILLRFRLDAPPQATGVADAAAGEEIFLEGHDAEFESAAATRVRPAPLPGPSATSAAPSAARPVRSAEPTGRRVLQYHRVEGRAGLAGSDLAQYPGWVRALLVLAALALAGGIAYLAFRGTSFVKEQVRAAPLQEP